MDLNDFWFEASQGGRKQQDQQEEQQEGPKGAMARFDPRTLGCLWAQWGPQVDPKGPLGGALGGSENVENQWILNDSWFGSK